MAPPGEVDTLSSSSANRGLSSKSESSSIKYYTWQEIAKHNTQSSAWVYYEDTVYDVTKLMKTHPGGKEMILLFAGRDITEVFYSYHPWDRKSPKRPFMEILNSKYKIGKLKGPSEFARYLPDESGFYKTLRRRVQDYFEKTKQDPKDPKRGIFHVLSMSTIIFLFWWLGMSYFRESHFLLRFICMIIAGSYQALILIHTMHDCSHTSFSHSPTVWKYVGRYCLDILCGSSFDAWLHQHVVGHHIYTNTLGLDPDCPVDEYGDMRRIMKHQKWMKHYKLQYIFLPILYCLLSFKSRIQDLTDSLWLGMNGSMRVNPYYRNFETHFRQYLCKGIWLFRVTYFPMIVFGNSFWEWFFLFFTMELMTGYYLAYYFQVSHVSTELDWPVVTRSKDKDAVQYISKEWARVQVETCLDYGCDSYFWAYVSGNLNNQTIHHLLPCVSQYYYTELSPLVQKTCKEFNVKFNKEPHFFRAWYRHVKQLYDMSLKDETAVEDKPKIN